jgi:NAD(P)H-dependent FMN reductase
MLKLNVIIASTRPGRAGLPVATWFVARAKQHARFDVSVTDLKEQNLPHLDEPKHPRLAQYEHAHTKAWSAVVSAADAFVMVTPEYNFGPPPALLNALDYLYNEWGYKPAAFVSYGGISGGTRSAQMTKQVLTTLKMVPLFEAVTIPFVAKLIEGDELKATDAMNDSATKMLDELHRWAESLKPMRAAR